jgi:serine/threonine protein kinase
MIGKVVSHYKIIEVIGRGGMGAVYKAEDLNLMRLVALKFMSPELGRKPESKARFLREGRSVAALKHANICVVYEIAELKPDQLFIAMEYYNGETLRDRLKKGQLELGEIIHIAYQTTLGLTAAHKRGIVHRDIKPGNIMITEDEEIKILDFGLARSVEGSKITKTGVAIGTAAYMSPEQIEGEKIDTRTDIWSLGVMMYEMLLGYLPFSGQNDPEIVYAIVNEDPRPFPTSRKDIPVDIIAMIEKCLIKDPNDRYQSLSEIMTFLKTHDAISKTGRTSGSSGDDALIGKSIDNYRIMKKIGRGGMGIVYRAMDVNLEKIVAIKAMHSVYDMDEEFINHFMSEAKALAKLENTHIVHIYALRTTPEGTFIVMEYVDGTNLDQMIKEKGSIQWQMAVGYCRQLLRALHHAHKANVIHRDIKPSNVLVSKDGLLKLTDFGLAKIKKHSGVATKTKFGAGTLYYMSPEQIRDPQVVDIRSDIYSLGMTFYEMLMGKVPFSDISGEFNVQKAILENTFPEPAHIIADIPVQFSDIVMKTIAKNPEERYQSVLEILEEMDDLDKNLDATGTMTIQAQKKKKYRRKPGISRNLKWIIGVIISVTIAVIIYINIPPDKTITNQPATRSITESIEPIYGQLEITSEPSGAIVFLDEQQVGETPFRHDSLGEKTYQIRLRKTGYQDWYDSGHDIKAGIFHPIHVSLNKTSPKIVKNAGLQVDIFPEGTIYLNGKKTEKNVIQEIIPGEYNIKFEHPEYGIQEEKILLTEGENKKLTCYFQQWVSIQSISELGDPIWASIVINDKKTDFYTPRQIALSPGEHKIYLSKSGYELVEQPMTFDIKPTFEKIVHPVIFHLKKY